MRGGRRDALGITAPGTAAGLEGSAKPHHERASSPGEPSQQGCNVFKKSHVFLVMSFWSFKK
eukprot:COSAG02_NODE_14618_length_1254_cov_1.211255_3_plen_62_part_00